MGDNPPPLLLCLNPRFFLLFQVNACFIAKSSKHLLHPREKSKGGETFFSTLFLTLVQKKVTPLWYFGDSGFFYKLERRVYIHNERVPKRRNMQESITSLMFGVSLLKQLLSRYCQHISSILIANATRLVPLADNE